MKKAYEAPVVEKVAFQYRDQVVVASNPGLGCSQWWHTPNSAANPDCKYSVTVQDSGF